jgi:hypothetical protein
MTRCTGADNQGLLALPGRSGSVSTGVNDLAAEVVLSGERCRHLGHPTSETGSENDVGHGHIPSSLLAFDLADDGDVPLLRGFVELGASRVERGFAPGVNLEHIDVGFEEVGELAGGSEDWPLEDQGRRERGEARRNARGIMSASASALRPN